MAFIGAIFLYVRLYERVYKFIHKQCSTMLTKFGGQIHQVNKKSDYLFSKDTITSQVSCQKCKQIILKDDDPPH